MPLLATLTIDLCWVLVVKKKIRSFLVAAFQTNNIKEHTLLQATADFIRCMKWGGGKEGKTGWYVLPPLLPFPVQPNLYPTSI